MNIQPVSSMNNIGYQLKYGNEPVDRFQQSGNQHHEIERPQEYPTPEQINKAKDAFEEKNKEYQENVKSNYQKAKDIELAQTYYQQQQKVLDAYLNASSEDENNNDINAIHNLTDFYTQKHQTQEQLKTGIENIIDLIKPNDDVEILPIEDVGILPVSEHPTAKPIAAYNNVANQPGANFFHLSA